MPPPVLQVCGGCLYGVEVTGTETRSTKVLECRRYPPALLVTGSGLGISGHETRWPVVPPAAWCGEWKKA